MTSVTRDAAYDLADPAYREDPYPTLRRLREQHGVFHHDELGGLVVTRYADIVTVLRDSRWNVRPGAGFQARQMGANEMVGQLVSGFYFFLDDPQHPRLRSAVSGTFTPRVVQRFQPRIREITTELLDRSLAATGRMEVMSDLAYPLTVRVITEILGVTDPADQQFFLARSGALAGLLEWDGSAERMEAAADAMFALSERFVDLIEERRAAPRDDLLSALLSGRAGGQSTQDDYEVLFMCALLLTVGYETTMNLLGNGIYTLLTNPEQFALLTDHPEITPNAVEELLRYEAPVQMTARQARTDITVAGRTIREGELVIVLLASANRDPEVFGEPDRLDLRRPEANRHMTFAHGPHFCLGAGLARAEGEIVFSELARRFPAARLGEPVRWRDTSTLRSLDHLPVAAC